MNKYFYHNNRLIHTRPTRLSAEPTIGIEPCWPLRSPGLLGTERDMPAKKNKKIIFEIEKKYSKAYIFLGVWSSFQGSQRSQFCSQNICSFWLETLCQVQKNSEANFCFLRKTGFFWPKVEKQFFQGKQMLFLFIRM